MKVKQFIESKWKNAAIAILLLAVLIIPAIPVTGDMMQIQPATAGGSLWEVDGSETQLIDADEIDMQTKKIINVVDPASDQDAATKKYVDDNIVTDHGSLDGLADDDHPQYIKDAEFTQDSGFLVGTGAGTFQEETGATLRSSIGTWSTTEIASAIDTDVATHSDLTTGVHGAGSDYVALFGVASTVVSKFTPLAAADVLWRRNVIEDSSFVAKINAIGSGGLTATNVPYDTDSLELSLPDPSTNSQWGKVVLHNTTRGNSRFITDVDTANNVITTESSTDDWADSDDITIGSQTCSQGGTPSNFFDVDMSAEIPATATAVFLYISLTNISSVTVQGQNMVLWHPYSAFAGGKLGGNRVVCGYEHNTIYPIIPVIDQTICLPFGPWGAICGDGITAIFRVMGYWE